MSDKHFEELKQHLIAHGYDVFELQLVEKGWQAAKAHYAPKLADIATLENELLEIIFKALNERDTQYAFDTRLRMYMRPVLKAAGITKG